MTKDIAPQDMKPKYPEFSFETSIQDRTIAKFNFFQRVIRGMDKLSPEQEAYLRSLHGRPEYEISMRAVPMRDLYQDFTRRLEKVLGAPLKDLQMVDLQLYVRDLEWVEKFCTGCIKDLSNVDEGSIIRCTRCELQWFCSEKCRDFYQSWNKNGTVCTDVRLHDNLLCFESLYPSILPVDNLSHEINKKKKKGIKKQ